MSGPKYETPETLQNGLQRTISDPEYAFKEGFNIISFNELRELVLGQDKDFDAIWHDIYKSIGGERW